MADNSWLGKVTDQGTTKPKSNLNIDPGVAEVELWLQKHGVAYSSLLDLPIANINERKSRQNQARPTALVPESVDRFALALRAGEVLPPVVGYKSGNQVVLIDGNNRDAAHRKVGLQTIRAFVVHPDTASEIIHFMTVEANAGHGVTPELSWRMQQAVWLKSLGFTDEQACAGAAVSAKQFSDHNRAVRAETRAKALKIHDFSVLSTTHKIKLGTLQSDPVFLHASRLVIDYRVTADDTAALLRELKTCGTEASAIACVGRWAENRKMEAKQAAAIGRGSRMTSARTGVVTGLGKIMAADITLICRQTVTDVERSELINRIIKAQDRLLELQIALETVVAAEVANAG